MKMYSGLFTVFAASTVLLGCGGGSFGSFDVINNANAGNTGQDSKNCLQRYDDIQVDMKQSQLEVILGAATYLTNYNGNLLGAGWENIAYGGQVCSFLVGFDRQGLYTKGVTGEGFDAKFVNYRNDLGF